MTFRRNFIHLGLCVFLFLGIQSLVQARVTLESSVRPFQGKTIRSVSIDGLKRIEKEAVLGKIVSQPGKALNLESVRSEVEAVHRLGYFDDVEVRAVGSGREGVALVYRVRERPVIAEILIEGNEQIGTSDLREVIQAKEWSILDINRVRQDVELIRKHYEDKGYYTTKVRYRLEKVKDKGKEKEDEIRLTYVVDDYDKVQIKKITFLNNKAYSDSQLKSVFQETKEGGLFSFMSGAGSFKESGFKVDLQRLTYWYLDNGYVKFRYESPIVTVSDDKKWVYITVYVDEGQEYAMGSVDFSGDLLFQKDELREALTLNDGDVFRYSLQRVDIIRLQEKYQDLGYAFANVTPRMNIRDDERRVDIEYGFEKGHLVRFGEINVIGNAKTYDKVIRRELRIHEGDLFHGSNLRISRERVERLGYFQPGEVIFNTISRPDRDDVVDVEISIKERSTGSITLGAGYSSANSFFLMAQISEMNLFGRGHTLSLQGNYAASADQRKIVLGFTEPYTFDTNWTTGFDLFYENRGIPGRSGTRNLGFDLRVGYPLGDDINAFLTYKNVGTYLNWSLAGDSDIVLDEGVLSSLTWSVVRDVRNNRFEPTGGNYQSVTLETAGLGGDKKFLKWSLNNRIYHRVVGDLVFRNSTELGQVFSLDPSRGVSPSERFYLGGAMNMKGFAELTLGPRMTVGGKSVPEGGSFQVFSLFEVEYPLIREAGLKWVGFFDVGNSFRNLPGTSGEPFVLRADVGMGIRWFSPIGPLRFEWGFPIQPRFDEPSPNFVFMIGSPF